MRYQLRYSPVRKKERLAAASFFLWAREDLNPDLILIRDAL